MLILRIIGDNNKEGLKLSEYKYQIENGVAMEVSFARLLQQDDFENEIIKERIANEKCHIYMVCARPSITFDPESIVINEDYIQGRFKINKGKTDEFHDFIKPNPSALRITDFHLEFPYREISFLNDEGKEVSGGKASFLYPHLVDQYNQCLDLKVLYVGQAYGKDGHRLAADRLASHSTLQKIYSDIMYNSPNEEAWLVLLNFENYAVSMAGGDLSNASSSLEESLNHFINFSTTPISFDQEITFTEAALIKYFEPHYNKEYKTNFPSSSHSSYDQCYKLDINSIMFVLETNNLFTRLYSESVEPLEIHAISFPLHSTQQRKSMLENFNNLNSE